MITSCTCAVATFVGSSAHWDRTVTLPFLASSSHANQPVVTYSHHVTCCAGMTQQCDDAMNGL